jgi:hypothetical protein
MIEDHHITRLEKGAMAEVEVDGPEQPDIFQAARPDVLTVGAP